jgi:hypothetical protein
MLALRLNGVYPTNATPCMSASATKYRRTGKIFPASIPLIYRDARSKQPPELKRFLIFQTPGCHLNPTYLQLVPSISSKDFTDVVKREEYVSAVRLRPSRTNLTLFVPAQNALLIPIRLFFKVNGGALTQKPNPGKSPPAWF